MFAFLEYPHYGRVSRPAFAFFDRYMASVERRLARMIDEQILNEEQMSKLEQDLKDLESSDNSQTKTKEGQEKQEPQSSESAKKLPYRGYFFESHTARNGDDLVEEHRQRVTESDGSVHVTTRRRIGDRWYENETHIDKDGKNTSKDTWHNVPDDKIDSFKQEWEQRHSLKHEKHAELKHEERGSHCGKKESNS